MGVPQAAVDALSTVPLAAHMHSGPACVPSLDPAVPATHNASCSHHPGEEVSCHGIHIPFFGTQYICVHHVDS
jgi:hypothetical protein